MKLLISVTFGEETKERLMEIRNGVKSSARNGRFTAKDNLRMNLLVLHGIDDIRPIKQTIEKLSIAPFCITFNDIDRSRRDSGDIYWAKAEPNPTLDALHAKLYDMACDYEYEFDDKPFKARVEIGKRVIARPNFIVPEFSAKVDNITIIRSMRINKENRYKELYKKEFN